MREKKKKKRRAGGGAEKRGDAEGVTNPISLHTPGGLLGVYLSTYMPPKEEREGFQRKEKM